ncbi:hypothetical protein [Nocardiopsis potens]|uniref:hypothetical protein n=1 Tax=Nocardiopsis potens TaxID=1246458 RepID=UPI00034802C0|nr:hypothetical protein [Nocardiopsis potens]
MRLSFLIAAAALLRLIPPPASRRGRHARPEEGGGGGGGGSAPRPRPYADQAPDYNALCDATVRHAARWSLAYEPETAACYVARSLVDDGVVLAASEVTELDRLLIEFVPPPRIRPYAVDPQAAAMARASEQRLLARMIREAAAA